MLQRAQSFTLPLLLIATAVMGVLVINGCRNHARPGEGEAEVKPNGEPDHYSATVVRTIDDGESREPIITREVRSGEQVREEWTERGHSRALIWRPDLSKCYLLDLDRLVFVEITPSGAEESLPDQLGLRDRASADSASGYVEAVDRALDDAPAPERIETRELHHARVGDYLCTVYEQRATFPDGHTEITKTFRARDLGGLALRIESESQPPSVRVITERKEISLDIPPDAFTVPSTFKKIDKLEQ